jgi:Cupin
MQDLANSYAFWVFLIVAPVGVNLLPTMIGLIRGVDRMPPDFHVLLHGAAWLSAGGREPVALRAGDLVLLPHRRESLPAPSALPLPRRGA